MVDRNRSVSRTLGKSRAALTITHPNAAGRGWPSRLLKYSVRKRKAMLGDFDFSDFLFAS